MSVQKGFVICDGFVGFVICDGFAGFVMDSHKYVSHWLLVGIEGILRTLKNCKHNVIPLVMYTVIIHNSQI